MGDVMAKCLRPTVQMHEHELRDAIGNAVEFELFREKRRFNEVDIAIAPIILPLSYHTFYTCCPRFTRR